MKQLKDMCKEARDAIGLSQAKFAKIIGTNQTEISFIERGFIPEDKRKINAIKALYDLHCKIE